MSEATGGKYDYTGKAAEMNFAADLLKELLEGPNTSIFHNVEPAVIEAIMDQAKLVKYKKNDVVFNFGDPTDNFSVLIIIEGYFNVTHYVRGTEYIIAVDSPGVLLADVEFVLYGVDPIHYRRGAKNTALATVKCQEDGQVIAIPHLVFRQQESVQLLFNLARHLAVKLMRRNAATDEVIALQKRERIIEYLRDRIVGADKTRENPNLDNRAARPLVAVEKFTETDVSNRLGIIKGVVNRFYIDKLKKEGLQWSGSTLEMTKDFYNKLASRDGAKVMAERKKAGRPKQPKTKC